LEFTDIDDDGKDAFLQKFSFMIIYMKQVIEYFDERDSMTGKRRRSFKSVKHRFRRVTDSRYLGFVCLLKRRNKTAKVRNINNYVYHKFERARKSFLPVHDIDLRRAERQTETIQESFNRFVASEKCLFNFKIQPLNI